MTILRNLPNEAPPAVIAAGSENGLSEQSVKAVLFVLLLAFLMAFSAILLILANDAGTAAAHGMQEAHARRDV
jgi:hypothetical protein